MVALNRSTQILIDNHKDIYKLATKSDILEIKYELLKWLVMTQIAIAGLLVATKLM